jgi:hypothetical protein
MDRWTALSVCLVSLGALACGVPEAPAAPAQVDAAATALRPASVRGGVGAAPVAAASAPARSIYSIVPD